MPLDTKTLADAFERHNQALTDQAHGLMTQVVADKSLHARLTNTLAMLGHLGHRDEKARPATHHADDLLAAHAVHDYTRALEAAVAEALPHVEHKSAHDLAVAMVTHFRAGWTHRLHHKVLDAAGHKPPPRAAGDDHAHRAGLAERLHAAAAVEEHHMHRLCEIESRLYEKLLGAFVNAIATMPSSVETGLTALGRMMQ